MPVIALSAKFIDLAACPPGKSKIDFHDSRCKGLMIEVRATGGKTYYLRYRDIRRRQHQFRIGSAEDISLDQARKRADELRGQIALGGDPVAEKNILREIPTFAEFAQQRYLPFIQGYKRSWRTSDSYLRTHLLPALGHKFVDQITRHEIINLHHGMRQRGKAAGTANQTLALLRTMFSLMLKWEIPGVTKNPAADIPMFKNERHRERFLTIEEAHRLYRAIQDSDAPLLRYLVPMYILTGARKREVLDAKWEDFDLERRLWCIPKSKTGVRFVPLSDGVIRLLGTVPRVPGSNWVFPSPRTGKPLITFYKSWDTARKQAILADVRVHDLRHSFASFLINAGRSLYEVQKILGHTEVRTTQRYAHLSQDTLIDACNAVVNSLGDALQLAGVNV